jgi:Ca2+-binding RTX toxin-like protein
VIAFDSVTGLLRVVGDEAGPAHDMIDVSVTGTGFVDVVVNGLRHSSDSTSPEFDTRLSGATSSSVEAVELFGLAGNDVLQIGDGFTSAGGRIDVWGGQGADRLVGGAAAEMLRGGRGADTILGGPGEDTLRGGAGADSLSGGPGNDFLGGGRHDDELDGGEGDDTLAGRLGNDTLSGGDGTDRAWQVAPEDQVLTDMSLTGQGTDAMDGVESASLTGGDGDDVIDASQFSGRVTLRGGLGADRLIGTASADLLDGGSGDDTLDAGEGPDILFGADGDDSLLGGPGDDFLIAELIGTPLGRDTQDGGSGADTINLRYVSDAENGGDPDVVVPDEADEVLIVAIAGHHAVGGHHAIPGADASHFLIIEADGHHFAWEDRDANTPNVTDIWYDFRARNGFPNDITADQRTRAVDALNLWETAANNAINFIQNTTAAAQDIINIGTGDLLAVGGTSVAGGVLGLGGAAPGDHVGTRHPLESGVAWMDSAETWDTVIGNEMPDLGLDWFTVAVQEIGHALGLAHLDDLGGLNMMNGTYTQEQTTTSANDDEHMRIVYGGNLVPRTRFASSAASTPPATFWRSW